MHARQSFDALQNVYITDQTNPRTWEDACQPSRLNATGSIPQPFGFWWMVRGVMPSSRDHAHDITAYACQCLVLRPGLDILGCLPFAIPQRTYRERGIIIGNRCGNIHILSRWETQHRDPNA